MNRIASDILFLMFTGRVSCAGRITLADLIRIAEVWKEESSDDGGNIVYARNQRLSTSCLIWTTPSNAHQPPQLVANQL